MKVTATAAQKRLIADAIDRTHGVIVFPATHSAWMQIKMAKRMAAAGLIVPGSTQVTAAAVRLVRPEVMEAAHAAAHNLNGTEGGPRLEDVKPGDVITYRDHSRNGGTVFRRLEVHTAHVFQDMLMLRGTLVTKSGKAMKVQPRFGAMPVLSARHLVAINA